MSESVRPDMDFTFGCKRREELIRNGSRVINTKIATTSGYIAYEVSVAKKSDRRIT